METILHDFMGNIGDLSPFIVYCFFLISGILQITFPPYPGDTILVFGGYLGSAGLFGGGIPILISYWLGTIASSLTLYELGVWKGESFLRARVISKYFPHSNQKRAKIWLLKYGIIMFFLCKFVPGINTVVIMLGGALGYKRLWAYLGVGLASVIHNILFLIAGGIIGNNLDAIGYFLSIYNKTAIAVAVVSVTLYVVYLKSKKSRQKSLADKED